MSFDDVLGVQAVEIVGLDVNGVARRVLVNAQGGLVAEVGTTPVFGQKTQAGVATAIVASSTPVKNGIIIQALSTNLSSLYVGGTGVTTITGFELQAGQATSMAINDISVLYIIGTSGDGICYIAAT